MTAAAELEKRLKSIIDYVQDCERRVQKGEIMDLQGLDRNVIEICDAIAEMPKLEAQPLETQMTKLIGGLETLAVALKEQEARNKGVQGHG